jgi:hypothetical protein
MDGKVIKEKGWQEIMRGIKEREKEAIFMVIFDGSCMNSNIIGRKVEETQT